MKKKVFGFLTLIIVFLGILLLINDGSFSLVAANASNMNDAETISFGSAIICELFVSIHMSVFVLMPLSKIINEKKSKDVFITLFSIRAVILIVGDFINPTWMMTIDFLAVFVGAFIVVPISGFSKNSVKHSDLMVNSNVEVSDDVLQGLGLDSVENTKKMFLDQYIETKYAFSDFKYQKLLRLCSNNIYHEYKTKLNDFEKAGYKEIYSDFNILDGKITDAFKSNQGVSIFITVNMEYLNYIVDNYNKVIYGSNNNKVRVNVELEFYKAFNYEIVTECSNCGSPVTEDDSDYCSYCGSAIDSNKEEFVLSKEKIINN